MRSIPAYGVPNVAQPLLQVDDLRTYFSTPHGIARAVDGVSFVLEQGETLALVGESGCGKSMTALSILQLVPEPAGYIDGGRILFEGEDLLDLTWSQMREVRGNDIAMIFQEPMTSLNGNHRRQGGPSQLPIIKACSTTLSSARDFRATARR